MNQELAGFGRFAEPSLYILAVAGRRPEAWLRDHGRRRRDLRGAAGTGDALWRPGKARATRDDRGARTGRPSPALPVDGARCHDAQDPARWPRRVRPDGSRPSSRGRPVSRLIAPLPANAGGRAMRMSSWPCWPSDHRTSWKGSTSSGVRSMLGCIPGPMEPAQTPIRRRAHGDGPLPRPGLAHPARHPGVVRGGRRRRQRADRHWTGRQLSRRLRPPIRSCSRRLPS